MNFNLKRHLQIIGFDQILLNFDRLALNMPHFQKCPFEAISIINLPSNLEKDTTHRYSANSFKLHRLPIPRPGEVLGLVGTNGIGKSTALKILAGKQKPNLGRFNVRTLTICVILLNTEESGFWPDCKAIPAYRLMMCIRLSVFHIWLPWLTFAFKFWDLL